MKQWDGINDVSHEINPSFEGFVRNPVLGRMIKKGSHRYKDIYPHLKKGCGRPQKEWDPLIC